MPAPILGDDHSRTDMDETCAAPFMDGILRTLYSLDKTLDDNLTESERIISTLEE